MKGQTLSGGKGDHLNPGDVDKNELRVGIEVEYEHAEGDKIAALDVALDHLQEDPHYYTKLVKSGIVDEPKAIKLAKKLLGVEPMNESVTKYNHNASDYEIHTQGNKFILTNPKRRIVKHSLSKDKLNKELEKLGYNFSEFKINENVKIKNIISEELRGLLKEEPELWKYIYNFGNIYVPKRITEASEYKKGLKFTISGREYLITGVEDFGGKHDIIHVYSYSDKKNKMLSSGFLKRNGIDMPKQVKKVKTKGLTKREYEKMIKGSVKDMVNDMGDVGHSEIYDSATSMIHDKTLYNYLRKKWMAWNLSDPKNDDLLELLVNDMEGYL